MSRSSDIELALDVRGYEQVFILNEDGGTAPWYSERWIGCEGGLVVSRINQESVVIVDGTEVSRKILAAIGSRCPRVIAFLPRDRDQEKVLHRAVRSTYPFASYWEFHTLHGKVMMFSGFGQAYDRDRVLDMRPSAVA